MSKRERVDMKALTLADLTADTAVPMREAVQRTTSSREDQGRGVEPPPRERKESEKTENLAPLNFKVPAAFRKRYRESAASADLKLNELLYEAYDAWLEKKNLKS